MECCVPAPKNVNIGRPQNKFYIFRFVFFANQLKCIFCNNLCQRQQKSKKKYRKNVVYINFYMWLSLSLFIFSLWLFFYFIIFLYYYFLIQLFILKKRLSIARLFSIWFLFCIFINLFLIFFLLICILRIKFPCFKKYISNIF